MMRTGKIRLLYDCTHLALSSLQRTDKTGIYFTAHNILVQLLRQPSLEIGFYCNAKKKLIAYLEANFGGADTSRIFGDADDLGEFDAFLSPFGRPSPKVRSYPRLTTHLVIYDLVPYMVPEYQRNFQGFQTYFGPESFLTQILNDANPYDFYYAISEHTKRDYIQWVPEIDPEKITTVLLAASENFHPAAGGEAEKAIKAKYNIPPEGKYILSVCTLEPRKNLISAIRAFVDFIEKNHIEDLSFVLCGGSWKGFADVLEREIPAAGKYRDRIIRTGYVPDADLAALYSNALWFVYTSKYEGFGLPPLEAMQCGCPVITANNSSLPEVVGDAGIMIDWFNHDQHVKAFTEYYFNPDLRCSNSEKGLARAKGFSWEKCGGIICDKIAAVEERKRSTPKVTVAVIANTDGDDSGLPAIERCLASVDALQYDNKELLLVDGGVSSETSGYLRKYAGGNGVIVLAVNGASAGAAMNEALAAAKGRYMTFLRPPAHYCDPRALAVGVMKLEEVNACFSYADAQVLGASGKTQVWRGDVSSLLANQHFCHDTAIFNTDAIRSAGGFAADLDVAAFAHLLLRLVDGGGRSIRVPLTAVAGGVRVPADDRTVGAFIDMANGLLGDKYDLTVDDWRDLYDRRFVEFDVKPHILRLIKKIPHHLGFGALLRHFFVWGYYSNPAETESMVDFSRVRYRLFHVLPMERVHNGIVTQYKLFGKIPMLKIRRRRQKITFYLFNVIPICKMSIDLLPR